MSKLPITVAGAFIRDRAGRILLARSDKWGGKVWNVPGGKIHWGETIEDALKREVKEEVGLTVHKVRIFAVFDAIFPKMFFEKKHFIFLECECVVKDQMPLTIDHREIKEAKWFTPQEAIKLDLEGFTRKSVNLLIESDSKTH